jgi:hypothetical protein
MAAIASRQPLELSNWRDRWLVLPSGRALHRISEIAPDDPDDIVNGEGVAVCGARGYFMVPGLFSRMGLKRCDHCCDHLAIPRGAGAPFNAAEDWKGS